MIYSDGRTVLKGNWWRVPKDKAEKKGAEQILLDVSLVVGIHYAISDKELTGVGYERTVARTGRIFKKEKYLMEIFDKCPRYKSVLWYDLLDSQRETGSSPELKLEIQELLDSYGNLTTRLNLISEQEHFQRIKRLSQEVLDRTEIPLGAQYSPVGYGLIEKKTLTKLKLSSGDSSIIFG